MGDKFNAIPSRQTGSGSHATAAQTSPLRRSPRKHSRLSMGGGEYSSRSAPQPINLPFTSPSQATSRPPKRGRTIHDDNKSLKQLQNDNEPSTTFTILEDSDNEADNTGMLDVPGPNKKRRFTTTLSNFARAEEGKHAGHTGGNAGTPQMLQGGHAGAALDTQLFVHLSSA